jgi:nucleoside phosphorylase
MESLNEIIDELSSRQMLILLDLIAEKYNNHVLLPRLQEKKYLESLVTNDGKEVFLKLLLKAIVWKDSAIENYVVQQIANNSQAFQQDGQYRMGAGEFIPTAISLMVLLGTNIRFKKTDTQWELEISTGLLANDGIKKLVQVINHHLIGKTINKQEALRDFSTLSFMPQKSMFNSEKLNYSCDILIHTPLKLEQEAVLANLKSVKKTKIHADIYYTGSFQSLSRKYQIMVKETGSNNIKAVHAVNQSLKFIETKMIFLIGIAAGIKDVKHGDVVIGSKAYGVNFGKATEVGLWCRPQVVNFDESLLAIAKNTATKLRGNRCSYQTVFGPIASTDTVIVSRKSESFKNILHHYNDSTAVEMESYGFAYAVWQDGKTPFLNIRGISDLIEDKSQMDIIGGQIIAAKNAASFLFELIQNMGSNHFGI